MGHLQLAFRLDQLGDLRFSLVVQPVLGGRHDQLCLDEALGEGWPRTFHEGDERARG